jgi:exodeoxyribonuclease-5
MKQRVSPATARTVTGPGLDDDRLAGTIEPENSTAQWTGKPVWSPQQEGGLGTVRRWIRERDKPVFRLFGYAGTGKTELARWIGHDIKSVHYSAFTGKAAHVLRQRGCTPVSTIHSLIYKATYDPDNETWYYEQRDRCELAHLKTIIVDECSMVANGLARDLLSYKIPILAIGDPAQLPPVIGPGFFMSGEPDVVLTEIHRQAAENPILRLADQIRRGKRLPRAGYRAGGGALQITEDSGDPDAFDVTLVGRNETRRRQNRAMRHHFGFARRSQRQVLPQPGETLCCLHNDYRVRDAVFNGSLWHVKNVEPYDHDGNLPILRLTLINEYSETVVRVPEECFTEGNFEFYRGLQQFDYGYALTTHKAQGSEWSNVRLFNEAGYFRRDAQRWLYTGITRARSQLTIVDNN